MKFRLTFKSGKKKRMHYSRMRTVRCSSHLGRMSARGCVSAHGGCLNGRVGCLAGECLPNGVSAWHGGMSAWGVSAWQGCTSPPLWTEFLTQTCENITFPQLRLRTVKMPVNLNFVSTNLSVLQFKVYFSVLSYLC